MFSERLSFANAFNICVFAFIENTILTFIFIFSHINTKIVISFTPSFMALFLKFIKIRIISSDIMIHTLNIADCLSKQYQSITVISIALSQ